MSTSVQPLVIDYSFQANREAATDLVDAAQLDVVLGQVADKLNEIVTALAVTTRDDNALADATIELRTLSNDTLEHLSQLVNEAVT